MKVKIRYRFRSFPGSLLAVLGFRFFGGDGIYRQRWRRRFALEAGGIRSVAQLLLGRNEVILDEAALPCAKSLGCFVGGISGAFLITDQETELAGSLVSMELVEGLVQDVVPQITVVLLGSSASGVALISNQAVGVKVCWPPCLTVFHSALPYHVGKMPVLKDGVLGWPGPFVTCDLFETVVKSPIRVRTVFRIYLPACFALDLVAWFRGRLEYVVARTVADWTGFSTVLLHFSADIQRRSSVATMRTVEPGYINTFIQV